jgi:hypothetical protein
MVFDQARWCRLLVSSSSGHTVHVPELGDHAVQMIGSILSRLGVRA